MSKWFLPVAILSAGVAVVIMSAALEYQREHHSHHIPTEAER